MTSKKRGVKKVKRISREKSAQIETPDFNQSMPQQIKQQLSQQQQVSPQFQQPIVPQFQQFQQPIQPQAQQYAQNLLINSPTGIVEFDELLGGGFPKGSTILLAGSSGSGKTILSFQWLFDGIRNNENGLYITLTEPLFKSVKNLETMSFYDRNAIEQERLKILDIRQIYHEKMFDKQKLLEFIEEQVKQTNAKRLCIDSVTAIAYNLDNKAEIRNFIFELGKILATLGCTSILTSEVTEKGKVSVYNVEEFISDAILKLDQTEMKDELMRIMQIIKVRGRAYKSDELPFRISERGITVFPKLRVPLIYASSAEKISTGNPGLDKLLFGGLFKGSSSLIAGSTGTGKSIMSMQFILDGLKKGEPCLYAGFEESREQLIRNAIAFGWNIEEYEKQGLLILRCVYPGEKFIEEHLSDIKNIVESKKIQRCVVDSLSSIGNSFDKEIFRSFAKRLNAYLKTQKVTTLFTSATSTFMGSQTLTESHLSTMVDNILMLRHTEIEGSLRLVLNVVKVRGSAHSKGLREYEITSKGVVVGESMSAYEGVMTGVTKKIGKSTEEKLEEEFARALGPIGLQVFEEQKEKGLTEENLIDFVDSTIAKEGIMKNDEADRFKTTIIAIFGGKRGFERTEDNMETSESFASLFKTSKSKEEKTPITQNRNKLGFFAKLFKKVNKND